jgi:hypothetical protein
MASQAETAILYVACYLSSQLATDCFYCSGVFSVTQWGGILVLPASSCEAKEGQWLTDHLVLTLSSQLLLRPCINHQMQVAKPKAGGS